MRTRIALLILLLFFGQRWFSQDIVTDSKVVWRFTGYKFTQNMDEGRSTDTLYTIQKFPPKNDWKIYYDSKKTRIATLIHYDSTKKTITSQHFQRDGKLLQEFCASYKDKKGTNPAYARVADFHHLKMFADDSLICHMTGQKEIITVKYRNYITKVFFDQTMFFSTSSWLDDLIGSTLWRYYENGNIKAVCTSRREYTETVSLLILECRNFDENGCLTK